MIDCVLGIYPTKNDHPRLGGIDSLSTPGLFPKKQIPILRSRGEMMDINAKIVEMFWCDYTAKLGNDVSDRGQTPILQDFLEWLDLRKTNDHLIDLRLVKNPTALITVDEIMGVE